MAMQMPFDPHLSLSQARTLGQEQRLVEAESILSAASAQFPANASLRFEQALTRYRLGLPAADLFAEAHRREPANQAITGNLALALASEGRAAEAEALLRATLARQTDWLAGHRALAVILWTHGGQARFVDHIAAACRDHPANPELWLAWFHMLAQARDWAGAAAVLDEAERHIGETPAMLASRLFLAVETENRAADALLSRTSAMRGDGISLCRIRHALRQGNAKAAEAEALPHTAGPSASLFWPYLSLAWRMADDPRWQWLERPDELITASDVQISASELAELAALLRSLHTAETPFIDQSVRGGTQTDRSVLLRHEPALQRIKDQLIAAISDYVAVLPAQNAAHPLLSAPRGPLLIEGSWSVRLQAGGYNVPHSHPRGWLSTAFYVSVPAVAAMGVAPAGHIAFGQPPAELGLDLTPYHTIAPQPGRLAIFPSTTWHGTLPFDQGERLVIAFDIRKPQESKHA